MFRFGRSRSSRARRHSRRPFGLLATCVELFVSFAIFAAVFASLYGGGLGR